MNGTLHKYRIVDIAPKEMEVLAISVDENEDTIKEDVKLYLESANGDQIISLQKYSDKLECWFTLGSGEYLKKMIKKDNTKETAVQNFDSIWMKLEKEPNAYKRSCFRAGWDAAMEVINNAKRI